MRLRASSVAALAALLLGGLAGCVAAPAPSCPAAALLAPPASPPPLAVAPTSLPLPGSPAPISVASPEPAPPASAAPPATPGPAHAAPSNPESEYAVPRRSAPQQFSGSSTAPSAAHAAARRGERRRPAGRHRDWDLDEHQIEAQWINPPVGAGE